MPRSVKKGPWIDKGIRKMVERIRGGGQRPQGIKTWWRRSTITSDMWGVTRGVHKYKRHIPINVTETMAEHKLAESAPTRTFRAHPGTKPEKAEKPPKL